MGRSERARRLLAASMRAYRLLLLLYPGSFRREYGADMVQVFGDLSRDAYRCGGVRRWLRLWADTLQDALVSAPREHLERARRPARRHGAAPAGMAFAPFRQHDMLSRRSAMGNGHMMRQWVTWLKRQARPRGMRFAARSRPPASDRDRFQKFTERARKVLQLAQEEARRGHHDRIGTEHLLLGLIREGDGIAAKVLMRLGVNLAAARTAVELIIGHGDRIREGEIGLTPRAKRVIELAVDEAQRLNHHYVGTEHLLLGLIREGDGIAAKVLEQSGVRLEDARRETLNVLREQGGGA